MRKNFSNYNLILLILLILSLILIGCDAASVTPTATNLSTATPTAVASLTAPVSTPTPTPQPAHLVVLDPGHGGEDWGTFHTNSQGKIDLLEKDVTLQIAVQTAELLRAQGYRVVLTRDGDYSANNPPRDLNGDGEVNEIDDLQARINLANQNKADLFLSIHINSSDLGDEVGGLETWYCEDRPFADQNKLFAQLIQKESVASFQSVGYQAQNRRVDDDLDLEGTGEHIFVLGPSTQSRKSATEMPGALTEALFITNDTEAALLADNKVIKALAAGYTRAINQYFNS